MESAWLDDFFQQKKSQSKDNHEHRLWRGREKRLMSDLKFIEQRYLRFPWATSVLKRAMMSMQTHGLT